MKKRVVKVLLATLVLSMLAFTGCSKSDKKSKEEDVEEEAEEEEEEEEEEAEEDTDKTKIKAGKNVYGSWFPFGKVLAYEGDEELWKEPDELLDVEKVLSNTEITPEFMYGNFFYYDENSIESSYDAPGSYVEKCEWVDMKNYIGTVRYENLYEGYEITTMPFAFKAGTESYFSNVHGIPGYNWCGLYFAVRDPDSPTVIDKMEVPAAYEINGNKITFSLMTEYDYDYDANSMEYQFGDKVIEYTFERKPLYVSFSNGTQTVNLLTYDLLDHGKNDNTGLYIAGRLEEGEVSDIPIGEFSISCRKDLSAYNCNADINERYASCAGTLLEDGLFILYAEVDDVITSYQYVVFDCADDGAILCGEDGTHYFLKVSNWSKENYGTMTVNNIRPEDMDAFEKLSEETINYINNTRDDLLTDLQEALQDIGMGIVMDEQTGDIILDASVLFDSNSAEVSKEGKQQLTDFALALDEILQLDEYKDFIGELHISGHTDSDGDYEYNKELSLKRAEAVRDCMLEALADYPEDQAMIESIITVEGCSYDELIYDEDGNEDKEASRRVVFSFYINIDNYVEN